MTQKDISDKLDILINKKADRLNHAKVCPRCNTRGFELYQKGYCARCAYIEVIDDTEEIPE